MEPLGREGYLNKQQLKGKGGGANILWFSLSSKVKKEVKTPQKKEGRDGLYMGKKEEKLTLPERGGFSFFVSGLNVVLGGGKGEEFGLSIAFSFLRGGKRLNPLWKTERKSDQARPKKKKVFCREGRGGINESGKKKE